MERLLDYLTFTICTLLKLKLICNNCLSGKRISQQNFTKEILKNQIIGNLMAVLMRN